MKHVTGYLAYWDELKRRHPDLLLDSCASGGRRVDLETMRRSVPRTRSDYLLEPIGEQCHTYGLASWLPYFGSGFMDTLTYQDKKYNGPTAFGTNDAYVFRSVFCPVMIHCLDVRRMDLHYDTIRALFAQWRRASPCLLGDFYPLTPYSTARDAWMAWQFDRPDLGSGMVQAFRRPDSLNDAARFKLSGLESNALYSIEDIDSPGARQTTGRKLIEEGWPVSIRNQPGAAVLIYSRHAGEAAHEAH
jgi:alpha-galactosidase